MKKLKMLKDILKHTNSDKILISYILFILVDALVILLFEPSITTYGDALWYCYEVISTTGFGEFVAYGLIARICSVLLTVYSLIVIAIITGVVTNFYIQITKARQKGTIENFMNKLERLPDLSRDELIKLSKDVKNFRKK